eukprot:1370795-Rhodomonas_salina.1
MVPRNTRNLTRSRQHSVMESRRSATDAGTTCSTTWFHGSSGLSLVEACKTTSIASVTESPIAETSTNTSSPAASSNSFGALASTTTPSGQTRENLPSIMQPVSSSTLMGSLPLFATGTW